jgi:cytidine deaminase
MENIFDKKEIENLIIKIKTDILKYSENAYAPYSRFRVVAALVTKHDIYFGVNIENRSFGLTICAERSAIAQAISKGDKTLNAIVIYSPDYDTYLPPCGACRQVISEFSSTLPVIMLSKDFKYKMTTIDKLLPEDSLSNLKDQNN